MAKTKIRIEVLYDEDGAKYETLFTAAIAVGTVTDQDKTVIGAKIASATATIISRHESFEGTLAALDRLDERKRDRERDRKLAELADGDHFAGDVGNKVSGFAGDPLTADELEAAGRDPGLRDGGADPRDATLENGVGVPS